MGFLDRSVENSFDRFFDLNRDGVLDPVEQAVQLDYISREINGDETASDDEDFDLDDFEDDFFWHNLPHGLRSIYILSRNSGNDNI